MKIQRKRTKRLSPYIESELWEKEDLLLIIKYENCTEQQIPRPVDKRRRTVYYSGKKKKHTIKAQLMVNNHGCIIHKNRL